MKKISSILIISLMLFSCAELNQISNELIKTEQLDESKIANGLKEALVIGVNKRVEKLTRDNGFYSNELVRIEFPDELSNVEKSLRSIGLETLTNEGIKALNKTAQKAVKEAMPIFISAIKDISIEDSKAILFGEQTAASAYLRHKTEAKLYEKFQPIIQKNFQKVGANQLWANLIDNYNQIPFTQNVNPNLTDYVTSEALKGVYKMIEQEEIEIRTNINKRSTQLLKQVFALQD